MAKSKRQQQIRTQYSKMASSIRSMARQRQQEYGKWLKGRSDALAMAKPLKELGNNVTTRDLKRAMKQLQRLRPALYKKDIEKNLEKTVTQLQGANYGNINKSNVVEFLGMMEDVYYKALAKIYGSPEVAQEINRIAGSRKPLSQEQLLMNMKEWSEHIDEMTEKASRKGKQYMPGKLNLRRKPSKKSGSKNYG